MKFAAALFSSLGTLKCQDYTSRPTLSAPYVQVQPLYLSLSLLGWNFELQVKNF